MESTITVKTSEYRACVVEGKKALFHKWSIVANVIGESPMIGGHSAGQIMHTFGIVEYEDGTVREVLPQYIKFTDNLFNEYAVPDERQKREV